MVSLTNKSVKTLFFYFNYYEKVFLVFKKNFWKVCRYVHTFFILCFYVIHTMLLKNEVYDSLFFGYNSNFFGHSIFWLYVVLIRSKNMCKWYKLSIKSSMVMNFLNILYYHHIIERIGLLDMALVFSIISILCWLIFVSTCNISKVIR